MRHVTHKLSMVALVAGGLTLAVSGSAVLADDEEDTVAQPEDPRIALLKCGELEDPNERLACYDSVANPDGDGISPLDFGIRRTVDGDVAVTDFGLPEQKEQEEYNEVLGFSMFGLLGKKNPESITVEVVESKKDFNGKWIFYTDDGQVWRQVDNRYFNIKGDDDAPWGALISEAPVSGFYFWQDGNKTRIRVKRVK